MKNTRILIFLSFGILFFITSCYVYRPYTEVDLEAETLNQPNRNRGKSAVSSVGNSPSARAKQDLINQEKERIINPDERGTKTIEEQEEEKRKKELELAQNNQGKRSLSSGSGKTSVTQSSSPQEENLSLKEILKPKKIYKIKVEDKHYKIQVDKWEGDTLVSHRLRHPEKKLRFHENQIDEDVLARKFSKPMSDIITVGAYVSGGAALLLLIF